MSFGRRLLEPAATFYGVSRGVLVQENDHVSRSSNRTESIHNTSSQQLFEKLLTTPSLKQESKDTTLLTYTAYKLKDSLDPRMVECDEASKKLKTPVVETGKGAALVHYITDPMYELESGMSSLKMSAKYLDSHTPKSISEDAVKCISLVKEIERNVDLLTHLTSNQTEKRSVECISPPRSQGQPEEETSRASWLSRIQQLPRSAATLAKNTFKGAYNKCHIRNLKVESPHKANKTSPRVLASIEDKVLEKVATDVTTPVVVKVTNDVPDTKPVMIQERSKRKHQVHSGYSSSRLIKMSDCEKEIVAKKLSSAANFISEAMLTPMQQSFFTTKPTQCKGLITLQKNSPVHVISSSMDDKDQLTAVKMIEETVDQAQDIDKSLATKFKTQFAETFGGTWLAQCGGAELQNNIKEVNDQDARVYVMLKNMVSDGQLKTLSPQFTVLGEHVCFNVQDTIFLLHRHPAQQTGKPKNLSEKAAIIKQSTMPSDMQWFAVKCARLAMDKREKDEDFSVAEFLNKKLNDAYSPKWHCVVGPDIQEALIFNNKENLLFLQLCGVDILVWQS